MDDEKLKAQIGANIAAYRKRSGMTQAGLAEKLNYSDKAVSKWERGESIPDVLTLIQLAEQFEITVGDLLVDPNKLPDDADGKMQQVVEKTLKRKADKRIILYLSSVLVWFVALFIFVVVSSFDIPNGWLPFFYAIPANAIVLLSLRSAWHDFRWNRAYISVIVWGCLISFYATMRVFCHVNLWRVFLLGIPGQLAILLWFRLFRPVKEKEVPDGQEGTA
ncbi:MAG: helix-turn-helix transcriptional regulator [Oscillospiraceae bacterium]|nr:helix-turn-helix transcriptional regulator [Oscillospiraceae bacterium]